jgi:hypothetical protein
VYVSIDKKVLFPLLWNRLKFFLKNVQEKRDSLDGAGDCRGGYCGYCRQGLHVEKIFLGGGPAIPTMNSAVLGDEDEMGRWFYPG